MNEKNLQYHMRLRVFYKEQNFGPGVAALMNLVKETQSLSAACKEIGMAYSKAWKIIKKAEEDLGFQLMESRRGGEGGGKTLLTEAGENFLLKYMGFQKEMRESAEIIFHKYFIENHTQETKDAHSSLCEHKK